MSENRRYYWLKLKEDFFDDETIQYIEEQPNGETYCLFYLKLCLKALKTDGILVRLIGDTYIPYDIQALSRLTHTDVDTVKSAMDLFARIGVVKLRETGEIFLTQIDEMIGSETNKAQLMRQKRAKEKLIEGNNVTSELPECYQNVTQSIEYRDKSIDTREDNTKSNSMIVSNSDIFCDVIMKNGTTQDIPVSWVEEKKKIYPRVDVESEILKAREWLKDNPTRRKENWQRYMGSWLNRCDEVIREKGQKPSTTFAKDRTSDYKTHDHYYDE